MRLLLDSGVDLFVADDIGATPIDVARDWQRLDILEMLAGELRTSIISADMSCSNHSCYGCTGGAAYRANEFLAANRERVELAVNGLSNQVELPLGVRDIIADYLC